MKGKDYIGDFNNTGEPGIDQVKMQAAQLIDAMAEISNDPRRLAIASTGVEQAAMMAVKAHFSQPQT